MGTGDKQSEITKRYKWMEILEGGLLKEPEDQGPYYSTESLNGWDGFENEEDAMAAWIKFKENYIYVPNELVLVPVYKLK